MPKKSKKSRPGAQAKGMGLVTISMPVRLLEKVDAMATREKRSRSNFIVTILERLATDRSGK